MDRWNRVFPVTVPPLAVYSVRSLRTVYIYTLSERRSLTMKYEAPVAVVVDFENDYVVAAPSIG